MGLRVPQDISLIGYDNVRNARYFSPALTDTSTQGPSEKRHSICCSIALLINAKNRSPLRCIRVLSSAARLPTARSSIIAAFSSGAGYSGACNHSRFNRFAVAKISSSQLKAGEASLCCRVRQQAASGNGFSSVMSTLSICGRAKWSHHPDAHQSCR